MNQKAIALPIMILCLLAFLGGCGEETIEGNWLLVSEIESDGTVLKGEDLEKIGVKETYAISGDSVQYTCYVMGKEIPITMTLKKTGDKSYDFMAGSITFASVTLDGKNFSYTVGEGSDSMTMIFERQ